MIFEKRKVPRSLKILSLGLKTFKSKVLMIDDFCTETMGLVSFISVFGLYKTSLSNQLIVYHGCIIDSTASCTISDLLNRSGRKSVELKDLKLFKVIQYTGRGNN